MPVPFPTNDALSWAMVLGWHPLVGHASDDYRRWVRTLLTDLAREAGAPAPEVLGRQLRMIYDGASLSARMDHDPSAAIAARATAEVLLNAALATGRTPGAAPR